MTGPEIADLEKPRECEHPAEARGRIHKVLFVTV
jgi:hypothetical protein